MVQRSTRACLSVRGTVSFGVRLRVSRERFAAIHVANHRLLVGEVFDMNRRLGCLPCAHNLGANHHKLHMSDQKSKQQHWRKVYPPRHIQSEGTMRPIWNDKVGQARTVGTMALK